jgi:hypothetical protein
LAAALPAASDADLDGKEVYVAFGANDGFGLPQERLDIASSSDGGRTWHRDSGVGQFEYAAPESFPVWSDTDRAGNPYHAWIDDDWNDDVSGIVKFTRGSPGNWETLDVTPFDGAFGKPWIAGGREEFVAIVFYATEPGTVEVDDSTRWYVYALVTTDALASKPSWTLARLDEEPVATDGTAPEDFFECAIGPRDRIHVTYGREITRSDTVFNPTRTYRNNLFYIQGHLDDSRDRRRNERGTERGNEFES